MHDQYHIKRHLERLFADCGQVELAARHEGKWWRGGIFDDPARFLETVTAIGDEADVYSTINRIAPRKRPRNRLLRRGKGVANGDVIHRARLVFDLDPIRARGYEKYNSTDAEMQAAITVAKRIAADFKRLAGWADPAIVYSGNGAHVIYRANIPANPETDQLVKCFYSTFAPFWGSAQVDFDVAVANAGRILRLPGTWNVGKQSAPDRPMRSATVTTPDQWDQCVTDLDLAAALERWGDESPAAQKPKRQQITIPVIGRGDLNTLDVVAWFNAHGHYKRSLGEGKHAVTCPWHHEHSTPDAPDARGTVVWESDGGWPTFYCAHNHCAGRNLVDVMTLWDDVSAFCARPFHSGGRVCIN